MINDVTTISSARGSGGEAFFFLLTWGRAGDRFLTTTVIESTSVPVDNRQRQSLVLRISSFNTWSIAGGLIELNDLQ